MSGYYPYLVCGLPDLAFNMDSESFSYEDIHHQIFELLSPADRQLAELFLAFSSHRELVRTYLSWKDEEEKNEFLTENRLPRYQKDFLSRSLSVLLTGEEDAAIDMPPAEELENLLQRLLDQEFYAAVSRNGNAFVRKWFDFDLTLKNTLVAFAARKQKRSPQEEFLYPGYSASKDESSSEPEIIAWIKENMQQGDFGLKLRLAYADELFAALDLPDVYERERAVDRFRWQMAEEMVLGKDFQMDVVLAYLVKAGILLRWQKMGVEAGRQYLQEVVSDLRKINLQGDAV